MELSDREIDKLLTGMLAPLRKMVRAEVQESLRPGKVIFVDKRAQQEMPDISRQGDLWTEQESWTLLKELKYKTLPKMAKEHKRTLNAILWQLRHEVDRGNL